MDDLVYGLIQAAAYQLLLKKRVGMWLSPRQVKACLDVLGEP